MSTTLTPFEKFMRTDHARLTELEFLEYKAIRAGEEVAYCVAGVRLPSVDVETFIWRTARAVGLKLPLWREDILEREYGERLGDAAVDAWRCIDPEVVV